MTVTQPQPQHNGMTRLAPGYAPSTHQSGQSLTIPDMAQRMMSLADVSRGVLKLGVDYGTIPGAGDKPTLLQPGAQKLAIFYGLTHEFVIDAQTEDWSGADHNGEPFFRYRVRCILYNEAGAYVGDSYGDVNSWETRYRYRWVARENVPPELDPDRLVKRASTAEEFDFAIEKAETSGQYGKPAAYWQAWRQAIQDGKATPFMKTTRKGSQTRAYRMSSEEYRIPNLDAPNLVNTLIKISQKRAFVGAVMIATGASEFFTQDLEDYADQVGDVFNLSRSGRQAPDLGGDGQQGGNGQQSQGQQEHSQTEYERKAIERERETNPGLGVTQPPSGEQTAPQVTNWRAGEAAKLIPAIRQATGITSTPDLFAALEGAGTRINPTMPPAQIAAVLRGETPQGGQPAPEPTPEPKPEQQQFTAPQGEPTYYKARTTPIDDPMILHAQVLSLIPQQMQGGVSGKQKTTVALLVATALPDETQETQAEARHALAEFYFDKRATSELSKAEASALIDILTSEDSGLHPCAAQEIRNVIRFLAEEAQDVDDGSEA